jgi:hypothetical protein
MPLDDRLRDALRSEASTVAPDLERRLDAVVRSRDRRRPTRAFQLAAAAVGVLLLAVVVRSGPVDPIAGLRSLLSSSVEEAPGSTPAPTSTAETIVGSYVVRIASSDPAVASLGMAGQWELALASDSTITIVAPDGFATRSGEPLSGYIYAIRDDELHTNLFARHLGRSCVGSGAYRWHLDAGQLALERIDDPCAARDALLTSTPWQRIPE